MLLHNMDIYSHHFFSFCRLLNQIEYAYCIEWETIKPGMQKCGHALMPHDQKLGSVQTGFSATEQCLVYNFKWILFLEYY